MWKFRFTKEQTRVTGVLKLENYWLSEWGHIAAGSPRTRRAVAIHAWNAEWTTCLWHNITWEITNTGRKNCDINQSVNQSIKTRIYIVPLKGKPTPDTLYKEAQPYDVLRNTGKLSNRFRLLVRTIRFNGVYERTKSPKLYLLNRAWQIKIWFMAKRLGSESSRGRNVQGVNRQSWANYCMTCNLVTNYKLLAWM